MNGLSTRGAAAAISLAAALALAPGLWAKSSINVLNLANPAIDTTNSFSLSYSPSGAAQASGIITVNNGTKIADDRPYCVVMTLMNPGSQGGLSFGLYNLGSGSRLSLTGSPSSASETISGDFAPGTAANTSRIYTIGFRVEAAVLPPPGTYTAIIKEDLYGGSSFPPSGPILDTNTLTVSVTVGSFYDLSVVATGSSFALDSTSQSLAFGSLAPGQSLGADILVRSNVAYSLSLSSANSGALVNPLDPGSRVGYSLTSNGASISLASGPAPIATGASATYATPTRYRIVASILSFSVYPSAGSYEDAITVSLSAP